MAVLLETSLGDLTIDLLVEDAPRTCENFLKLCKTKYYNYAPFYNIQKDFVCQSGDPIGPRQKGSDGGSCIWGLLPGNAPKFFLPEFSRDLKHIERGTVSMATVKVPSSGGDDEEERVATSQFMITLATNMDSLDGKAAIFGQVVEGLDVLDKINSAYVDDNGLPYQDIRIRHTHILDDPFDDPPGLVEPPQSPVPTPAQLATVRIRDDEVLGQEVDLAKMDELIRQREAEASALTLEMIGDLPHADVKPQENVLFVCKLNDVTTDEDLRQIFEQNGPIISCEIVRDFKTGDSLQYAFIEFERKADCERAYRKMEGVLIDDRRIHVDFSQSVRKASDMWREAENKKRLERRQKTRGGFGGISYLEKKTHYRDGDAERDQEAYDFVFKQPDAKSSSKRARERSRDRSRDKKGRSRSPRGRDRRDYRDRERRSYRD